MKYFILIIFLISLKSFSQDITNNVDTINLCNELKIDSSDINCDTIIYNDNNIQEQEFDITIPHDSLKKKVGIDKKHYKLNKEEFLNAYGINDTSIAIINLFFKQRKVAKIFLLIEPITPIAAGEGLWLMWANTTYYSSFFSMSTFGIFLTTYSVIGFIALPIAGADMLVTWNRKSLYLILNDYNKNKVIPKFVKKKLKNKYFNTK